MEQTLSRPRLSPEASRAKYLYNKKYVDAYWERRARKEASNDTSSKPVQKHIRRSAYSDTEAYIKALEEWNATLWTMLRKAESVIKQSNIQ